MEDYIYVLVKNINEHNKLIRFLKEYKIIHKFGDSIDRWLDIFDYNNMKNNCGLSSSRKELMIQFEIHQNELVFYWPNYCQHGINIYDFIEKYKQYGTNVISKYKN